MWAEFLSKYSLDAILERMEKDSGRRSRTFLSSRRSTMTIDEIIKEIGYPDNQDRYAQAIEEAIEILKTLKELKALGKQIPMKPLVRIRIKDVEEAVQLLIPVEKELAMHSEKRLKALRLVCNTALFGTDDDEQEVE